MHLSKVMNMKYHHLLVPFITVGGMCAQDGMESPVHYASTLPPTSACVSRECVDVDVEEDDGTSSSSGFPGLSSAATSLGTTPQLGPSPVPEPNLPTLSIDFPSNDKDANVRSAKIIPYVSLITGSIYTLTPCSVFICLNEGEFNNPFSFWSQQFPGCKVERILANTIVDGTLYKCMKKGDVLLLPSGHARYYREKFGSDSHKNLKAILALGAHIVGVGGGAYYLSSASQFKISSGDNTGESVLKNKGVGLMGVEAIGPVSPTDNIHCGDNGEKVFPITVVNPTSNSVTQPIFFPDVRVYSQSACYFHGCLEPKVIAYACGNLPVAICNKAGNWGSVVLVGVQLEGRDFSLMACNHPVKIKLIEAEHGSSVLIERILIELGILTPLKELNFF